MKILFHSSSYQAPDWARYQHTSVVLAEGFQELGIEFYGNINYWWDIEADNYLIQKAPESFNAQIHIYSSHLLLDNPAYLKTIDWSKFNVLIDNEDGFDSPAMDDLYQQFNLILRCHVNKKFWGFTQKMDWAQNRRSNYLPQVVPWNFGLSKRIIDSVDRYRNQEVKDRVLCNFRMPHNIRKMGVDGFNAILGSKYEIYNSITDTLDQTHTDDPKSYWAQTGRRHNESYYKDINGSKFTYAFGGKLWLDPVGNDPFLKMRMHYFKGLDFINKKLKGFGHYSPKIYTMTQYGGWRFFESFLSNTVPIQIDLDYWKCDWPVMPKHGEHYWAVSGTDFESSAKDLMKLSEVQLKEISDNGRKWVLENYSPKAVAKRFLEHIK